MDKTVRIIKIVWWCAAVAPVGFMTAYNVVRQEINPEWPRLGNLLPNWHWGIWLSIFLTAIVLSLVFEFYFRTKNDSKNGVSNTQSASADRGGIAMQNVKDSPVNSNNTTANINWNIPPAGYEAPTRGQLKHKIGIDIQKFGEQFKVIRYKSVNDKYDQYLIVAKIFETIRTESLPHANLILKDTPIPDLLGKIKNQLTRYSLQIGDLATNEADRLYYGKGHAPVPRDVLDRIMQTRDTLSQIDNDIDFMVNQLVDLSQGN